MGAADDVLAVVDAFGEALHARDLEASLALVDDDPDLTIIASEGVKAHRGPADVRAFLERIYSGPHTYGWRWRDRWAQVHDGTAWFVAVGNETVEEVHAETLIVPYCLTGVAFLTAGRWRLRLLHASEAAT
ncbi:MAG: nuclear transport factor 2 family protein [Candidatus Limnocylindria bacterium]